MDNIKCSSEKQSSTNIGNKFLLKSSSTSKMSPALTKKICKRINPLTYTPTKNINSPIICKTPSANACYTPSSLFRNANTKSRCQRALELGEVPPSKNLKLDTVAIGDDRLTVAVRVRPLNSQECMLPTVRNVTSVNGNELTILVGTSADSSCGVKHTFVYDRVFYSCDPESEKYATQKNVYDGTAKPLIQRAFEGYNACLFAYGQTGSGKSYSMMGVDTLLDPISNKMDNSEAGIIPRYCYDLFQYKEEHKEKFQVEIEISFFEIYNEKIHDLLCLEDSDDCSNNVRHQLGTPRPDRKALKVREHPIWGPYVVDLSVHPVDSYESLRNWLIVGNSQRASAATGLNDKSSRSHSIFNIMLNITNINTNKNNEISEADSCQSRRSKVSLVDLAGSERVNNSNGERKREGVHINKSLLTLGKVIAALSSEKTCAQGKIFVPYRESALTWLLRENLGGNSKTVMLATISPASTHIDETLATLRYACQASRIINRVKVNESQHDKTIRELRAEIDRLKSLHFEYERKRRLSETMNTVPKAIIDKFAVNEIEMENLREQLSEREKELKRAQKSWMDRLKEAEDLRKSDLLLLRRKGLALELFRDRNQACLINLTDDPMLSETLFYILPPGHVTVGRKRSTTTGTQPDIILDGPLIAHNHCTIDNNNGNLFVTPESKDFETYLNGELVTARTELNHGDRLVFGGSHFFRISNPLQSENGNNKLFDFRYAYQEILEKREEKIRLELENEKSLALNKMEADRCEHERKVKEHLDQIELKQLVLKCDEEILDSERKLNADNIKQATITSESPLKLVHRTKSTLLDEINNIMQTPSKGIQRKIQLLVEEANAHCDSNNIKLQFKPLYSVDQFGVPHFQIIIIDKENQLQAEWPIARLQVWLNTLQEYCNLGDLFKYVDIEWKELGVFKDTDGNENYDVLRDSIHNLSYNLPGENIISDSNEKSDFESLISNYLHQIYKYTEKLKDVCLAQLGDKNSQTVQSSSIKESIERITTTLSTIANCVDNSTSPQQKV
ncbi:kinesin family member nebbish isoform X1 [Musca autumnalis]|uniref:kinesin family member nebbish isoform X1 n=1 Tax=Musca autumnalis TaxID=221902 RepID=UPI003CE8FD52